jgi:hypothetical protein
VQVDATGKLVLLGVEAQEVASSPSVVFPRASIPRRYAEEGASISINRMQVTGNSVRSFLAPTISRT